MNTAHPRAWLVDSHAQIWRAWHASGTEPVDSAGLPVGAVRGFADALLSLLETIFDPRLTPPAIPHAEHGPIIACVFDAPTGRGFRQSIYPDYKAHRPPAPEELTSQLPRCRALAEAAGLYALDHPNFEADDVIGTLVQQLRGRKRAVTILTGDKDLAQLLGPDDRWFNPMRQMVLAYGDVERHFGVKPPQIADWLALTGDTADNIPGVPGIGPRIAANLLKKHGNLDGIYRNLAAVYGMKFRGAPRVQKLLAEHEPTVKLSRRLTGIVCDLPLHTLPEPWLGIRPTLLPLLRSIGVDEGRIARWQRLPTGVSRSVAA
ncbi:5'-3' exonuclease H3TH domain-containing protein [Halothiobacillus sp. DCM-1]|uniref:5'-3' exonuclease n=1 Tax=Halothiobacillus sp. DCM-1 TaxID=3112558 RepID=UPI003249B114